MLRYSRLSMMLRVPFGLIAFCLFAGVPLSARGQESAAIWAALEEGMTKIIEEAEPSVVSIARIRRGPREFVDDTGARLLEGTKIKPGYVPSEFGSGVVFSPADQPGRNFILTMYHVVKGGRIAGRGVESGDQLIIHTSKRRSAEVEILAADPRSDLAVLQICRGELLKPTSLKPIRLAKSANYRKGQFVITLGNPYAIARDGSASAGMGMISNIARRPMSASETANRLEPEEPPTLHHMGTLLQIDGQLNLGTSGGAVLNRKGELIGMVTAMAALDGYEKSVGYAVPFHAGIQRVIGELAHGFEVNFGLLGITLITRSFPAPGRSSSVLVEKPGFRSPASQAGLQRDDVLLEVNGTPIFTPEDLMREVAWIGPGEKAHVKVFRRGSGEMTKVVTVTKWPVQNDQDIIATRHRFSWRNIAVDYATARRDHFQQQYREAVLITHVDAQTPKESPLRVGDFITHVDNHPVASPEDFAAILRGKKSGSVTFRLLDDRTVSVPVPE